MNTKIKLLLGSLAAIYTLYCVTLAFISPLFLKPLIEQETNKIINGNLTIDELFINPLSTSLTIEGVHLKTNDDNPVATLDNIYINIDPLQLLWLNIKIKTIELKDLHLIADNKPWLTLPKLSINEAGAALASKKATINEFLVQDLSIEPILKKNGSSNINTFIFNIENLLNLNNEESNDAQSINGEDAEAEQTPSTIADSNPDATNDNLVEKKENDWLATLSTFHVSQAKVTLVDQNLSNEASPEGISSRIDNIDIQLNSLQSDLNHDIAIKLIVELLGGEFTLEGTANPKSQESELNYALKNLELKMLNHYIQHYSEASIVSGLVDSIGTITSKESNNSETTTKINTETETLQAINKQGDQRTNLRITNDTTISSFGLKHVDYEPLLIQCKSLQSKALKLSLNISLLELQQLLLSTCKAHIFIDKEGHGNFELTKTFADDESGRENKNTPNKNSDENQTEKTGDKKDLQEKSLDLVINTIALNDHSVTVEDMSQGKKVSLKLKNLQAKIENIAKGKRNLSQYQLSTTINDHAPLLIKGDGNFLNPKISANTTLNLDAMGLKEFSPYTLNLSRRSIEKGALSIDIDLAMTDNELTSSNRLTVYGLKLGKKEKIDGASKLPLALAVGILKDGKGDIHIDVPISGNIDDPSFSIFGQVVRTLTGIITKAATAPLSIMGGVITGSDDTKERFILFVEGSDQLLEKAEHQLKKVARALKAHPELAIKLSGGLSAKEQITLTSTEAKKQLIETRQAQLYTALTDLEIDKQQLISATPDILSTFEQASIELIFFAR